MNTIKLGECPFCNSRVTADLETADGMVMAGLPECENGCPRWAGHVAGGADHVHVGHPRAARR